MKTDVRFDLREIKRAIKQLLPHVKQSRRELTEQAAKGFVKEVVGITPPAGKGKRGSAAKKAGEASILFDLARVMVAARGRNGVPLQDPRAIRQRLRVADYDRRIQSALAVQANKMRRQAEFLLTRALRRGGWK